MTGEKGKVERNVSGSSTRSKQHAVFGGGNFPKCVVAAFGARVRDEQGREFTDWISGLGAIGLGYQYPSVDDAVRGQMDRVVTGPLPLGVEETAAAELCEVLGWPEQVRWVCSGSEATAGALLIARRATGRRLVYSVGYHGWHEGHLPSPDLVTVPYNDDLDLFPPIDYRAAAVIVEGGRDCPFSSEYLIKWRNWCDVSGAILVMDEVWSGFRVAIGGCSEKYLSPVDVPDIATFSKALGNGYPVAAIVGPAKLMGYARDVSSTFGGCGIGVAAARAVIGAYRREPVVARLEQVGARLLAECPVLTGVSARPRFKAASVDGWSASGAGAAWAQRLAARGHIVHPTGITPTYAHRDSDVASLLCAISDVAKED